MPRHLPHLSLVQILAWADAHHARTGDWPSTDSGPVHDNRNERWRNIDNALRYGLRGLAGGSSLARLLAAERSVRNMQRLPPLTEQQIAGWAEAHRQRTGNWPTELAGDIAEAPGEVWVNVNAALRTGKRGLPGGDSLAALLARRRGARNRTNLPRLTVAQILIWADQHHVRTGHWPRTISGPVLDAPGETWGGIALAMWRGHRGLRGGVSLFTLLKRRRMRGRKSPREAV
jgi:hypothetical protein